jgi:hypothetical protein
MPNLILAPFQLATVNCGNPVAVALLGVDEAVYVNLYLSKLCVTIKLPL